MGDHTAKRCVKSIALYLHNTRPLAAGESAVPVVFTVERTRDGYSFLTRTVKVLQRNKTIFVALVSFHKQETGLQVRLRICTHAIM